MNISRPHIFHGAGLALSIGGFGLVVLGGLSGLLLALAYFFQYAVLEIVAYFFGLGLFRIFPESAPWITPVVLLVLGFLIILLARHTIKLAHRE
jgi:uncharacterized membrane protein